MQPEPIRVRVETRPKSGGTDVFLTYANYPGGQEHAPETWVCWMAGKCLLHIGDGPGVESVELALNEEGVSR